MALGAIGGPRERRLVGTMTSAAGLRANLGAIAFFALCNYGEAAESVQFSTGNGLHHLCTQGPANLSGVRVDLSRRFAGYYIQGAHDFMALQSSTPGEKAAWCLPRNVTTDQLTDVVCAYLRDNPQERHYGASSAVLVALHRAFPCSGDNLTLLGSSDFRGSNPEQGTLHKTDGSSKLAL